MQVQGFRIDLAAGRGVESGRGRGAGAGGRGRVRPGVLAEVHPGGQRRQERLEDVLRLLLHLLGGGAVGGARLGETQDRLAFAVRQGRQQRGQPGPLRRQDPSGLHMHVEGGVGGENGGLVLLPLLVRGDLRLALFDVLLPGGQFGLGGLVFSAHGISAWFGFRFGRRAHLRVGSGGKALRQLVGGLADVVDLPVRQELVRGVGVLLFDQVFAHPAHRPGDGFEQPFQGVEVGGEGRVGHLHHLVRGVRELGRGQARDGRSAAAQETHVAQGALLGGDAAAGVAARLHRLTERRHDVLHCHLQAVAGTAQAAHVGIGRGVVLGVANHHRDRVGGGQGLDQVVEMAGVDRDAPAAHVGPGARAADVDPAVQGAI